MLKIPKGDKDKGLDPLTTVVSDSTLLVVISLPLEHVRLLGKDPDDGFHIKFACSFFTCEGKEDTVSIIIKSGNCLVVPIFHISIFNINTYIPIYYISYIIYLVY